MYEKLTEYYRIIKKKFFFIILSLLDGMRTLISYPENLKGIRGRHMSLEVIGGHQKVKHWIHCCYCIICRVSTKWLYFLRKICGIFAQFFFCELLRMKRNEFCAILRIFFANCAKPEIFFCEFLRMKRKEFYAIFCAICAKPKVLRKRQNVTF